MFFLVKDGSCWSCSGKVSVEDEVKDIMCRSCSSEMVISNDNTEVNYFFPCILLFREGRLVIVLVMK